MGYIKHHAIVVTSRDYDRLEKAWKAAKEFECNVTDIVGPLTNGYCTFTVVPDGSKEGWNASDEGDSQREKLKEWMNENYENNWWEWVEVAFGSDDHGARITDHAWTTDRKL